jgi:hypothetical protein
MNDTGLAVLAVILLIAAPLVIALIIAASVLSTMFAVNTDAMMVMAIALLAAATFGLIGFLAALNR